MSISRAGAFCRVSIHSEEREVPLTGLGAGVHMAEDVFFRLDGEGRVEWVVSRRCDHASGTLRICDDRQRALCPMHGWQLDLTSLDYLNVAKRKEKMAFRQDGAMLTYAVERDVLVLPDDLPRARAEGAARVRFLAHACVVIDVGGVRIVTDPWLFGPCFVAGWWHAVPPKDDALEILQGADLLYISHNHPDHLHRETLAYVRRDLPVIVPDFCSGSTVTPLRQMGFLNVHELGFGELFALEEAREPVHVAILPAGDGRDDNGLYVACGEFSALLAVDSNALNNFVLPQTVSLLMTAFAGGASGFPVCFDVVPDEEKARIVARNKRSTAAQALEYIEKVKPRAFMPYAGFFTEAAPRDATIKVANAKNSSADMVRQAQAVHRDVVAVDPMVMDILEFEASEVRASTAPGERLYAVDDAYIERYISQLNQALDGYCVEAIAAYFEGARFQDDLIVTVLPTDADFTWAKDAAGVMVDFNGAQPKTRVAPADLLVTDFRRVADAQRRHLLIRVRRDALWHVVTNGLPWEDLSIGFQCRIDRMPDVYNSRFWFHFTNVHIGEAAAVLPEGRSGGEQVVV